MNTTVTEGQKRLIMGIITLILIIIIGRYFIIPMNETIEDNKTRLEEEQRVTEEMMTLINNTTLEGEYEKLKRETQLTFEKNYQSFKANEKIEEIFAQFGVELNSISIGEYRELDTNSYEMNVVQPKDQEAYQEMYTIMQGPTMQLFLVSQLTVSAEVTEEQFFQLLNAINNITPEGPGTVEMSRYCMQIPQVDYSPGIQNVSWTINMYGMQPPPIDAAEVED